jgi:menaquinone-dependent protoporphyrinogen IX oxidase
MTAYSINPENSGTRILIAVQKSPFKDAVLDSVAAVCRGRDIHISVVDVDALPSADAASWNKIIIFSSIMMWKFYPAVENFLATLENTDKVLMYNTSDSTRMQYGNIDTISSASTEVTACASALVAVIERAVRTF